MMQGLLWGKSNGKRGKCFENNRGLYNSPRGVLLHDLSKAVTRQVSGTDRKDLRQVLKSKKASVHRREKFAEGITTAIKKGNMDGIPKLDTLRRVRLEVGVQRLKWIERQMDFSADVVQGNAEDDLDSELLQDLVLRKMEFDEMEHLRGPMLKKKMKEDDPEVDQFSNKHYKLVGYIQKLSIFPFVGKFLSDYPEVNVSKCSSRY